MTISDSLRLVSTERIAGLLPPRKDCGAGLPPNTQQEPGRNVMGLVLVGFTEMQARLNATPVRVTRWLAPALDCVEVESVSRQTLIDGREEVHAKTLLRVVVGDPDSTLFARPAGYREVTPGELAAGLAAGHSAIPERAGQSLERLDDRYRANRNAKPR
jgi:hypothetical protein